jgi:flagellar L-ring protein precursor FlgH
MKRIAVLVVVAACAVSGADSLFSPGASRGGTLIAERKARFEVGDIITVLVQEKVEASTTANTNTKKESEVASTAAAAANQFLVADEPGGLNVLPEERLPNWNLEAENEHKTTGSTRRASTLTTTITCTVSRVYPNGNVEIEGKKRITVNRDDSLLVVTGLVRGEDISAGNTIQSSQIANAQVELKGKGPLWNNQRRGLLTRVLDWFAPY